MFSCLQTRSAKSNCSGASIFMYTGIFIVTPLNVRSKSILPLRVKVRPSYDRGTLSGFNKFFLLSLAAAATRWNVSQPTMVMSEPLSITTRTGTPASSISTCCWRLPPYGIRTCSTPSSSSELEGIRLDIIAASSGESNCCGGGGLTELWICLLLPPAFSSLGLPPCSEAPWSLLNLPLRPRPDRATP